jgi:menaquinone-dependent protoporphyrinogen IX oxidase
VKIEYLHASKYGNGAAVAAEFQSEMAARGVAVEVHHIRELTPGGLPAVDLYLFSSPGRFGKPIGRVRRFLKNVALPAGTPYAILTTEAAPKPDRKTGQMPTEEELAKYQHVRPIMNEILQGKGLVKVARGQGPRDRAQRTAGRRMAAEGARLCTQHPRSGRESRRWTG